MQRFDSQQLINLTWTHSTDGLIIFEWDDAHDDLRVVKLNAMAQKLTALREDDLLCDRLPIHLEHNADLGMPLIDHFRSVIDEGVSKTALFYVQDSTVQGWWQNNSVPLATHGADCLFMSFRNVTPIIIQKNEAEQIASTDHLTGIPNRRRMDQILQSWMRGKNSFTFVFIDLNKFKQLNDTHGHLYADRVLQTVANRLQECSCSEANHCTPNVDTHVFRVGGDEFFMLWDCGLEPVDIGDRVYQAIHSEPVPVEKMRIDVSASIGIVEYEQGVTVDALIKGADEQMYLSKGSDCQYSILSDWDDALYRVADALAVEMDSGRTLQLHYQPIFDLGDLSIASWEALIRWPRTDKDVTPQAILSAVKRYGLSSKFCLWTIERAQRDWKSWGMPDQTVAVNLSPSWLENDEVFQALLQSTGLAVEVLEDEKLESIVVLERIGQLREKGIPVYIDDFGKGYSSLGQLALIGPDKVKVDMVITQDQKLAAGTGALMGALKIPSVAEGIDTDERLRAIRAAGYTYGQGFRLMMPRSADAVREIVMAR